MHLMPHPAFTPRLFSTRSLALAATVAASMLAGCASRLASPEVSTIVPTPTTTAAVNGATPAQAQAAESALQAQDFERWKAQFLPQALAAGISPSTASSALANARLRPSIVGLDRAQPEFTRTPWQYLDSAVSSLRIKTGRAKIQEYAPALQAAAQRYGVPASVIAAIWGMESNYGSNFGSFSTVDALATLAFEGRRADWAQKELIAALRIIDKGDIDAAHMLGSWAGAMGHTQFLPSVFLQYAVDADGDGRRDIWGSMADVAASTANYLAHSGWNSSEPWGMEVRLPASFDYARAEMSVRQNSGDWVAEGVQSMDGQPLPSMASASIIAPAGARGPSFLVGSNFKAILRYNNSSNYALGVGLLSQQLAGGSGVLADWPRDLAALSRDQTRAMQTALNARGFSAGTADGVMGPATRTALRRFQQAQSLVADGYPTLELLQRLQAAH